MIYLITGATNAGKDKIAEYMIKEFDMVPIVSTTSRPMRPKEIEGKEYHFLTNKEFLKRVENGEFIEYRHYDTIVKGNPERWYYGVEKKFLILITTMLELLIIMVLLNSLNFLELN